MYSFMLKRFLAGFEGLFIMPWIVPGLRFSRLKIYGMPSQVILLFVLKGPANVENATSSFPVLPAVG